MKSYHKSRPVPRGKVVEKPAATQQSSSQVVGPITKGKWQGRDCEFAADRVVVGFFEEPESANQYMGVVGAIAIDFPELRLLRPPCAPGHAVFVVDPPEDIPQLAERLSRRPDVRYAEPDFVQTLGLVPNDPRFDEQWALRRVHAAAGWSRTTGAATGVVIGIIDSGISMGESGGLDHPDLNDPARYILGRDFIDGGDPRDLHGHGTHVAGIVAAMTNNQAGVAGLDWAAPTINMRVFDAAGNGRTADVAEAIVRCVNFIVLRRAHGVINHSGGQTVPSQVLRDACQYADRYGVLLCACAHNDAAAVRWPAAYSLDFTAIIAVGSTDENDAVSSFSNFGPEVTVVAPGRGILSTTPMYTVTSPVATGYDLMSGTSMATPLVAGLCALLWSQNPNWTHAQVRERLIATAKKLGPVEFNEHWGFGRVDIARALGASTWIEPVQHMLMQ